MSTDQPIMYALLVGINDYASFTVSGLDGCVNDMDAMEQLLCDKFKVPAENIKKLTDDQATHQAIKDAFQSHLIAQARAWAETGREGPPPAFLFHYSGHGSQAPDETGTEPDGMDETIVPHDSRTEGVFDIKDWELGQMVDELNKYSDNVTVILDCCHSGSGLRDVKPSLVRTRRCEPDKRPQPTQRPPSTAGTRSLAGPSGWALGEQYVLLAGCRDKEESNEHIIWEGESFRYQGALTYFLIRELSQMRPDRPITYRELHERVRYQVNSEYADQMPQCEGDQDRLIFGGLRPARDVFLSVVDKSGGFIWVGGGVAHGLTEGSQLHVYPPETRTLDQAGSPLATLRVEEVGAIRSGCTVENGQEDIPLHAWAAVYRVNHGQMQRGVVLDLPADDPVLNQLRARLAELDVAPYTKLVTGDTPAEFRVQRVDGRLELQDATGKRLVAPFGPEEMAELGRDLAHIVRYRNALKLENTASHSELTGAVGLTIKQLEFDPATQEPIAVPLEMTEGGETVIQVGQRIVLEVTNHFDQDLHLSVFNMAQDWSVLQLYPRVQGAHEPLAAGQTLSLGLSRKRRDQLAPGLPVEEAEALEFVKVIATVEDADFEVLQQGALKASHATRSAKAIGDRPVSALSALLGQAMSGGGTRALGAPPASVEDEWTTAQIEYRLVQAGED